MHSKPNPNPMSPTAHQMHVSNHHWACLPRCFCAVGAGPDQGGPKHKSLAAPLRRRLRRLLQGIEGQVEATAATQTAAAGPPDRGHENRHPHPIGECQLQVVCCLSTILARRREAVGRSLQSVTWPETRIFISHLQCKACPVLASSWRSRVINMLHADVLLHLLVQNRGNGSPTPASVPLSCPAVPDAAERQRERDSIDAGVKQGRDRFKAAKTKPRAAFNLAMQQATDSGFQPKLDTLTRQQRYEIFLDNLQQVDARNNATADPDEVYTVDLFSVFTREELRSFRRMPAPPEGLGAGRRLLYNNPSMPMPCACTGAPSEQPFQYGAVDVTNIPSVTWRAYMTGVRDQKSSSACGMFAVTAVIEAGFYMKWNALGWTPANIDLSEQDLVRKNIICVLWRQEQVSYTPLSDMGWPHAARTLAPVSVSLPQPSLIVLRPLCPRSSVLQMAIRWLKGAGRRKALVQLFAPECLMSLPPCLVAPSCCQTLASAPTAQARP